MKIIEIREKATRTLEIKYIDNDGTEDDYEVDFEYDEERKKWITGLSSKMDEEEIEAWLKAMRELSKVKFDPFVLKFDKEKK